MTSILGNTKFGNFRNGSNTAECENTSGPFQTFESTIIIIFLNCNNEITRKSDAIVRILVKARAAPGPISACFFSYGEDG